MWIVYSIATAFLLALSNIFAKCGSKRTAPTVITALRTFVIAIFAWVLVFTNGSFDAFTKIGGTSYLYIALTGCAFATALICYHTALKKGDLVRVSGAEKLTSLLIMLTSVFLFKNTSQFYIRIIAIVLFAIGVILMTSKKGKQRGATFLYGTLYAVAASAAYILKATGINVHNSFALLALILTVVLVVALVSFFIGGLSGNLGRLSSSDFIFTLLSGFAGGCAYISYGSALGGDPAVANVIISTSFAVTVGLAALFLKEKVSWKTICGMLLIVVGTVVYKFMV